MQIGGRVGAKDELHAVGVPAIQVLGLREVGVTADEDLAEAAVAAHADGPIDLRRGAVVRGPAAGAIEQAQHLAGVGQRHHQRMVTPGAVVGDVHALLARARGFHQRAVGVDACLGKELRRLPSPGLLADVVENVEEACARPRA